MSIPIVALLLGLVAAASAQMDDAVDDDYDYNNVQPVLEAVKWSIPKHTYTYIGEYDGHKAHIKKVTQVTKLGGTRHITDLLSVISYITTSTCSAPPPSVEVCLTSIFTSIEKDLTVIDVKLKKYEKTMETQMKHEHSLLHSEVSWVKVIDKIAVSVQEAVSIDYENEYKQVKELLLEKEQISAEYKLLVEQLNYLLIEIKDVKAYEKLIIQEYYAISKENWSIEKYISEILVEKEMIYKEEVEIKSVVVVLHEQIEKIYEKIDQLYKREDWLVSWEKKLYVDIQKFEKEIEYFKSVEINLKKEEVLLYAEQERLLKEVNYVEVAVKELDVEYEHIVEYLYVLEKYEKKLEYIKVEISYDAKIFISAYTDFTCEDSLLYKEACDSSHKASHVVYAAAPVASAVPV